MKKTIFAILCVLLLALSFSCAKPAQNETGEVTSAPDENTEVTTEPFESMAIVSSQSMYLTYETEKDLFDSADLVIVGTPAVTFTDGQEHYYNMDLKEVSKDSKEKIASYCTVRDIRVLEVLKGEAGDTVKVADPAVVKESDAGEKYIWGLDESSYIAKKNAKYVYYLSKSLDDAVDYYYINLDRGLVNIDGQDDRTKTYVDEKRIEETRERYADLYKKYAAKK